MLDSPWHHASDEPERACAATQRFRPPAADTLLERATDTRAPATPPPLGYPRGHRDTHAHEEGGGEAGYILPIKLQVHLGRRRTADASHRRARSGGRGRRGLGQPRRWGKRRAGLAAAGYLRCKQAARIPAASRVRLFQVHSRHFSVIFQSFFSHFLVFSGPSGTCGYLPSGTYRLIPAVGIFPSFFSLLGSVYSKSVQAG